MLTGPTLLLALVLLVVAVFLWRQVGSGLSLVVLLVGALWLIHGVPLMVYVHETGPDTFIFEQALAHTDRAAVLSRLLLAVSLMFVCLLLGIAGADRSFPFWRDTAAQAGRPAPGQSLARVAHVGAIQRVLLWTLVVAMLAVSVERAQVADIAAYFRFHGSEVERSALRREFGGTPYYAYNVMLHAVAPFLVMVLYCDDLRARRTLWPGALTVALFLAVLLGKMGTLSKAPPVIFLLQLILLKVLLGNPLFSLRGIARLSIAALLLLMMMTRVTLPELDLRAALAFLHYRMFDIPNEVLLEYFAAIPASIRHTWGMSFFDALRGRAHADTLATYFSVAELTRGSVMSSSNAMFIGDAWAQFSWPGVAVVSVAAGFLVRFIDLYGQRSGFTDQSACLVAGCAAGIFTILSTSFTTGLVTGGLAIIPVLSALFVGNRRA